jgi:20S proteasome alpha/beta subunit
MGQQMKACSNLLLSVPENRLERMNLYRPSFPKPKRKDRMTLIIGIVCRDAIVLASETQTTFGNYRIPDTTKIHKVEFQNTKALIAESGAADWSNIAIDRIQKRSKAITITNDDTIANFISGIVREIRNEHTSLHPNATPEQWRDYFLDEKNQYNLMVAYYFGMKPLIYNVEPAKCTPVPLVGPYYSTSGIGSELGLFLLREHSQKDMAYWFGAVIATYIIETVKEYFEWCGGKTHVGVIRPLLEEDMFRPATADSFIRRQSCFVSYADERIAIFSDSYIKKMADSIYAINAELKEKRDKMVSQMLRKQMENIGRQMMIALEKMAEQFRKNL